jgi:hypothetical protein
MTKLLYVYYSHRWEKLVSLRTCEKFWVSLQNRFFTWRRRRGRIRGICRITRLWLRARKTFKTTTMTTMMLMLLLMMIREKKRRLGTRRRKKREWGLGGRGGGEEGSGVLSSVRRGAIIFCHISVGLFTSYKKNKNKSTTFLICRIWGSHISAMKNTISWDIMPNNLLKVNQRFRGIYRLYLQGRIIQTRYQRESRWQGFTLGIFLGIFDPEDGGDMFLWNVSWLSTVYTALYPGFLMVYSVLLRNLSL